MKLHGLMVLVVGLLIAAEEKKEEIEKAPKAAAKPYLGIEVSAGATVTKVDEGSPAAGKDGLKTGDVIMKVGGKAVKTAKDVVKEVTSAKAGDEVTFHVKRAGKEMDVKVKLGTKK